MSCRCSRKSPPVGGHAAEGEGLGDVGAVDLGLAVQVGDGAGDAQHPVVAARGQLQALGGAKEELAPGGIGGRDPVEQLALGLGVGAQRLLAQAGERSACTARAARP
jgi:hypothetical protein